ncbi:hypothetical protein [Rhodohalobacter sp. 8-1]|uniref:hypothetical protein n=1 Tax=Rhodohalobacter sp. 8-1 TaxID=3131972 RepID=UPI0030EF413A
MTFSKAFPPGTTQPPTPACDAVLQDDVTMVVEIENEKSDTDLFENATYSCHRNGLGSLLGLTISERASSTCLFPDWQMMIISDRLSDRLNDRTSYRQRLVNTHFHQLQD